MYKYSYRNIIYTDHNGVVHFEVDEMKHINIVMWKKITNYKLIIQSIGTIK